MSDLDNQSSSASDSENDHGDVRPNRWTGPPTSWQSVTEPERVLAASLDILRNGDLSIHLFNAHALKKRARDLERPEVRDKSISDFPGVPEEDQAFKPPKGWTAWPLPPDDVPRTGEQIGPTKRFEDYTFKSEEDDAPSRELEDILVGVTLQFAKERFEGREQAEEEIYKHKGKEEATAVLEDDMDSTGSEYHDSSNEEPVIKDAPKSPQAEVQMKPVVSADDERSRDLLRPSIRHTLSKLDEVLMALHHARKTCHRYSHSEAGTTDDESVTDTSFSEQGQESPTRRPKGRPRKFANLPNRAKTYTDPFVDLEPQKIDQADLLRTKSTHRGRPKKVYQRLEGETQQEYLVRIARIQKKPLPAFAPPAEIKSPKSPSPRRGRERSRSVPAKRATSEELRVSRRKKLGLRDWSEVLGVAALVGFESEVLERAARRCADLFGEGMVLRNMAEVPFAEREGKDEVVRYEPEPIPDFGAEGMVDLSSSDEDEGSRSDSESQPDIKPGIRTTSNPSMQAVFCPIPACPRRIQGFKDVYAMKRHLQRGHKIQKEDIEDYILPSDEEMDGAVHIDGFLKQLKNVAALRGRYKRKGRKRKAEESEEDRDVDDDAAIDQGGLVDGQKDEDGVMESGSSSDSSS
ncbi:hypothetical protein BKA61DRAFT_237580 [Leptodontidium sp. MPI-SDFR-AT-0119]|nr:hypothetical protein BKA61DRAFT_237580 [Leptodontidium sp. MPI-SDFR-AT-0119]